MSTLPALARPTRRPAAPPGAAPRPRLAPGRHGLGFGLFLVVNAFLFVRPADVLPALYGVELYQYSILLCLLVSFPAVLEQLQPTALERRPISVCVLLLFLASVLSQLPTLDLAAAFETGVEGVKLLVYYFLLVGLVRTPRRIRVFIGWLALCAAAVTVVAALDFYRVIRLPRGVNAFGVVLRGDPTRLYGPGLFQDPNDICVLIATSLALLLGLLLDRRGGAARVLWLPPLAVFGFGFTLTQSRGGLLALLAGLGAIVRLRFGWGRALALGALGLPVLLLMGVRQTEISATTLTGRERIILWSNGLVMFSGSPLFGVGEGKYQDHSRQVAHNSYIHALGETGIVGGAALLGAFALAVFGLYRAAAPRPGTRAAAVPVEPELARLLPFLTGGVAAWATGMCTLSLHQIVPTYAILGLATVSLSLAGSRAPDSARRFDLALALKGLLLTVAFVVLMHVFVRVNM